MKERGDVTENISVSLNISVYSMKCETSSHGSHKFRVLFPGTLKGNKEDCKKSILTHRVKAHEPNKTSLQQGQVRTLSGLRETQDKWITGVMVNISTWTLLARWFLGGFLPRPLSSLLFLIPLPLFSQLVMSRPARYLGLFSPSCFKGQT